jgi:RNA-directed DNA polymerase
MGVERQQVGDDQLLFSFEKPESLCPGGGGDGGTGTSACEASQACTALDPARALTEYLMEEVCQRENLNRAYRRVKSNRGAPGMDGMTIHDLATWIREHKEELLASLMDGSYQPQPVRRVDIPKPGGGMRQLGIPTVVDRLVQQAILQVLEPFLDPTFSASSYGFRPGRSAHDALAAASQYGEDLRCRRRGNVDHSQTSLGSRDVGEITGYRDAPNCVRQQEFPHNDRRRRIGDIRNLKYRTTA